MGSDAMGSAEPGACHVSGNLLRTRAIVGTPAYMAPEQVEGKHVDARADVFSFSAALFEGLYGILPFPVDSPDSLERARREGRLAESPSTVRVPPFLRRALQRGLAADPQERFESMEMLLRALSVDHRRRWRVAAVVGGVVALGVATAVIVQAQGEPPCLGGQARLASVWDDAQRRAIRSSFESTKIPYAPEAATAAVKALDTYAETWRKAYTDACEATHVRGDQSASLLDKRMLCLDERLAELGALVQTLQHPDAKLVEKAPTAARSVRSLAACEDRKALLAHIAPPPAGSEEVVAEARRLLARARALEQAGRYAAGLEEAKKAHGVAARIAYAPLEAEALYRQGKLENEAGHPPEARSTLEKAWVAGTRGAHREAALRAQIQLVTILGIATKAEEALRVSALAAAELDAGTGDPLLRADLHNARGVTFIYQLRPKDALFEHQRAFDLLQQHAAPTDPRVATTLHNIAPLRRQSRWVEALATIERARKLREETDGPHHPVVANHIREIAAVEKALGHRTRALALLGRALEIQQKGLGSEHPALMATLQTRALTLGQLGRHAEMILDLERARRMAESRRDVPFLAFLDASVVSPLAYLGRHEEAMRRGRAAIAVFEQRMGKGNPAVGYTLGAMAGALELAGHDETAGQTFKRALDILRRASPGDTDLGDFLTGYARYLRRRGRVREAIAHEEEALQLIEKAFGKDHSDVGAALSELALSFLELHDLRRARELAERGLAVLQRVEIDPATVAEAKFTLAKALWHAPQERTRALMLARDAVEVLGKRPYRDAGLRRRALSWLTSR
jgi:tetratricopeptide (TPR) repeat protein